jgi:hypothetical protein
MVCQMPDPHALQRNIDWLNRHLTEADRSHGNRVDTENCPSEHQDFTSITSDQCRILNTWQYFQGRDRTAKPTSKHHPFSQLR